MEEKINSIIKAYKCDVEKVLCHAKDGSMSVTIELGLSEGYYVIIVDGSGVEYALRIHGYNEAIKTLGCMLQLVPQNP